MRSKSGANESSCHGATVTAEITAEGAAIEPTIVSGLQKEEEARINKRSIQ